MSTQRDDAGRIAAADLTDELWRWQHLAKYTGHSRGYAVTLADRPGFPARTTRPRPRHRPCAPVGTPAPRRRSPAARWRCGSRRRGWRRERRPTALPGRARWRVPAALRGGPGCSTRWPWPPAARSSSPTGQLPATRRRASAALRVSTRVPSAGALLFHWLALTFQPVRRLLAQPNQGDGAPRVRSTPEPWPKESSVSSQGDPADLLARTQVRAQRYADRSQPGMVDDAADAAVVGCRREVMSGLPTQLSSRPDCARATTGRPASTTS